MIILIIDNLLKGAVFNSYYNFITFMLLNLLVLNLIICVSSLNIIHSILFLILSLFCFSSILFLLNLKFIAILMLLIYAGAISILLIFTLMILDTKFLLFEIKFSFKYFFFFFFFFLTSLFLFIIFSDVSLVYAVLYVHIDYIKIFFMQDELLVLGLLLYNKNIFHLIIIGVILLAALIGSISMVASKKIKQGEIVFNQLQIDKKKLVFSTNKIKQNKF